MVKEKGNEKGKGAGKENAKAKAKEKSVNYLIRQDSALPPPVPRKKRKPKVQIRKAKDFPNAPTGELICRLKKHHPPPRRLPDRTGAGVRAAEAAASTIVRLLYLMLDVAIFPYNHIVVVSLICALMCVRW